MSDASGLLTYTFSISVSGTPLSDHSAVLSIEVESSLALPDSCTLAVLDVDHTEASTFSLGAPLQVSVGLGEADSTIFSGEVTSVEIEYTAAGTSLVVRGLDKSNRLFLGTATKAYMEMTASDIVSQIAADAGLSVGQLDSTDVTYPVATQANQSDWEYMQQLASESGRVLYFSKGEVYFVKPPTTDTAPELGDVSSPPIANQLVLGVNLTRIRAAVKAARQSGSVEMRGWDPSQKQAVVGQGTPDAPSASNDMDPATIAGTFGSKTFVASDLPFIDQSSADAASMAFAERLGAGYVEMEGEAVGQLALEAGAAFSLAGCGDPFDGKYVATTVTHIFDTAGYRTMFTVDGASDSSLGSLTGAGNSHPYRHIVSGVVPATISSVKDPKNEGRVQLAFPWLDDQYVSDWCRVIHAGAGANWGVIVMPEVNSEVLVAFDHGDIRAPYVIGGLYNGQDTLKPFAGELVDGGTGGINLRQWQSRTGHVLHFSDADSAGAITLETGDGNHSLKFDCSGSGTVTLKSNGDITVQGNNVTVKANQNVDIEATTQLTLKGQQVQIQAQTQLQVSSDGTGSVQASGPLQIKGATVMVNS